MDPVIPESAVHLVRPGPATGIATPLRLAAQRRRGPSVMVLLVVSVAAVVTLVVGLVLYGGRLEEEKGVEERRRAEAEDRLQKALAVLNQLTRVSPVELELAGDPDAAAPRLRQLEAALRFFKELLEDAADDPKVRQETGLAYHRLGELRWAQGQPARANEALERALALLGPLEEAHPEVPEHRRQLAACQHTHGDALRDQGQLQAAEQAYRAALDLQQVLVTQFPQDATYLQAYAFTLSRLGSLLFEATGRPLEAKEVHEQALQLRLRLVKLAPAVADYQLDLSESYHHLGLSLHRAAKPRDAEEMLGKALVLRRQLADEHPRLPLYWRHLSRTIYRQGAVYTSLNQLPQAETAMREARRLLKNLTAEYPRVPRYREELGQVTNSLGMVHLRSGEYAKALEALDEALRINEQLGARPRHRQPLPQGAGAESSQPRHLLPGGPGLSRGDCRVQQGHRCGRPLRPGVPQPRPRSVAPAAVRGSRPGFSQGHRAERARLASARAAGVAAGIVPGGEAA